MKTNFPLVFLLWGAGLGAAAQYAKVSVVFDSLPELYPEAGAALGLAVSLVGAVGLVLGVVAGILVARAGFRRTLLLALWGGAVLSALQALVPPFVAFLALRLLEGVSHLALVVALPTFIAQLSAPAHRGLTLTLWGTFFGVAFALVAALGQPLVARYGVPALFLAHAAYMASFALVLSRVLKPLGQGVPEALPGFGALMAQHVAIYCSPNLSAPGFGWLFYTFCFVAVLTVLPPYLPEAARFWVMAAMPLLSIFSSMTLGVALLRFMPAVRVTILGFLLAVLTMVWLWAVPAAPLACLALALALGLIQGSGFASVPELNQSADAQAQANGAMAQMGNLGNTLGTPVMVAALAWAGYAALPLLIGAMLLAGAGVHLWLAYRRARHSFSSDR
ncbi:MFS transporter [Lentibacter sp.]|uniref:MFS transporter n=1 Tax=Lentibacter sp. TaxID=2024994 RepID=UPI003F6C6992